MRENADTPAGQWSGLFTQPLAEADPEIASLIDRQGRDNGESINLVASESYCPRATLESEASNLVNKNASGYPPRVSFAGGSIIDAIERLAIERACTLFGAEHANVQPLSSTIANVAVLRALLASGDRILAFDRSAGGHSSHGSLRHVSGQDYRVDSFGVHEHTGLIDYEAVGRQARRVRPRLIIAGSSSYPRAIDFARLRMIADDVNAMLFADIAHVSGLIVAGLHPNPVPFCDVVTTSTHKTFCGPRTGGLILARRQYATALDAALAPGLQAAPGAHIIAARAVLFGLVRRPPFHDLMRAVVANAAALSDALMARGIPLYTGGTDTHMVVLDLRQMRWPEEAVNSHLLNHGIVANTCGLPLRQDDFCALGLRLGSTPMTIRGMGAAGFTALGRKVGTLICGGPDAESDPKVREEVLHLARTHPIPFQ